MEKVLVVDDEKEIADLVAFYLESENFEVTRSEERRVGKECRL